MSINLKLGDVLLPNSIPDFIIWMTSPSIDSNDSVCNHLDPCYCQSLVWITANDMMQELVEIIDVRSNYGIEAFNNKCLLSLKRDFLFRNLAKSLFLI